MKTLEPNELIKQFQKKVLTCEQTVNKLATYVLENIHVFSVQTDDDLRSEIVLYILDKGKQIIETYDEAKGDFFNYFYSFVKNAEKTCKRKTYRVTLQDIHSFNEQILEFNETCTQYTPSRYLDPEPTKVPFRPNKINIQSFQEACKSNKYSIKQYIPKVDENALVLERLKQINPIKLRKMIIILSLKSSYYLTDNTIEHISNLCSINKDLFADAVQFLKNDLFHREKHKKLVEERRNNAYYNHSKYKNQIQWMLEEDDDDNFNVYKLETIIEKYNKHTKSWKNYNKKLATGITNIRPTNKAIADLLGIGERQVSYYIRNARELGF